jgi:hypothetical protein
MKTPAKIKGLMPGEYELRLELPGYWPWNKKISVYPGQITHIQNVKLFKKTLPLLLLPTEIQKIISGPNKKTAYLPTDGIVLDMKTEVMEKIASSEDSEISFSADGKKLLIKNQIYNIKEKEKGLNLDDLLKKKVSNVKWDNNDSNIIFYQYNNSLESFNISSNKKQLLLNKEDCCDYLIKDGQIFYISRKGGTIKLRMHSVAENRTIKEIELPYSLEYQLLNESNGLINLYDKKYETLYLIDLFSIVSPLKEIIAGVRQMDWMDEQTLVYTNKFEIFILDMESGARKLLTRISEPINSIMATSDKNHIIYSTEKSLNILELGRQDKLFSTELTRLEKMSPPILTEDEKNIYFTAQIGNQKGLYKLSIK